MDDYHQYIENEVAGLRVAYADILDNGKEKEPMANCKLCGRPVRSAPVFHAACWEKAANELAEKFCDDSAAGLGSVMTRTIWPSCIATTALWSGC